MKLLKILILFFILSQIYSKTKRNILVHVFPGAKSHHFVMKEIFDYSKAKTNEQHEYYIVIHKSEEHLWKEPYKAIVFGEVEVFHELFTKAMQHAHDDPIFGYSSFNSAIVYVHQSFIDSNVIDELRNVKFDIIIGDIPNYVVTFLKHELKIPVSMYLTPPCTPSLFYDNFEWNSSYLPSIGVPFTDQMSFVERFLNSIYANGFKGMFGTFMKMQAEPFLKAGYDIPTTFFDHDSLIMLQCPDGIATNFSKPPNMITLSAVTPRDPKPLKDKAIDEFLNKNEKNIYISQGTIVNVIKLKDLIEVFNNFSQIGFVLSFKGEHKDINFPKNVLLVPWVEQNDLLGDKRINAFISHGGINSVMESLYHLKPVLALGLAIDQINTATYVKQKEFGIAFLDKSSVTTTSLINAIEDILKPNNKYLQNTIKYQKILKSNKNPREVFHYWLEYGLENGYSHLQIKAYNDLYSFQLNNYDVFLAWIVIMFILCKILRWILVIVFSAVKYMRYQEQKSKIE
jgi:2-hydroxyacylsphingosine 1-beta-galactosyltransferase